MGVEGLWDILQPSSSTHSLMRLAVDAFVKNSDGHRGLRLGIDTSLWLRHFQVIQQKNPSGENMVLQGMFFRCAQLLRVPVLPLFVFDGPKRPKHKRGKTISRKDPELMAGVQSIIRAFGFGLHFAPGEAEAELAHLNSYGLIDAVMTDDVDAFIFGARTIIRNRSSTLSSNKANPIKNAEGKTDDDHIRMFKADGFEDAPIGLTRPGLILIALLRGGDYHEGVNRIAINIALGLAKCGFGETLLSALEGNDEEQTLALQLWRKTIVQELRSNSHGHLTTRHPALASAFPADFPQLKIVKAYSSPVVSNHSEPFDWRRDPDMKELAQVCEQYFAWGTKTEIFERFRRLIWPGTVTRMLRHSALWNDELAMGDKSFFFKTTLADAQTSPLRHLNINQMVASISRDRTHVSTDGLREVRVELAADQLRRLEELASNGISGTRSEPVANPYLADDERESNTLRVSSKGKKADRSSPLRVWIPRALLETSVPEVLRAYDQPASKPKAKQITSRVLENGLQVRPGSPTSPPAAGPSQRYTAGPSSQEDILIVIGSDDGSPVRIVNGIIDLT